MIGKKLRIDQSSIDIDDIISDLAPSTTPVESKPSAVAAAQPKSAQKPQSASLTKSRQAHKESQQLKVTWSKVAGNVPKNKENNQLQNVVKASTQEEEETPRQSVTQTTATKASTNQ